MGSIPIQAAALAALIVLAAPTSAHEPSGAKGHQSVLPVSAHGAAATVDAFHAALARGDARSAGALLANDAVIFEEGGSERSKAEYLANHLPADAAFSKVVASSTKRRTGGANGAIAWVASEGRMSGNYKGKAVDRVTTETMLLRRTGRNWRIVHIHWSSGAAS